MNTISKIALSLILSATAAKSAIIVEFTQSGNDVILSATGTVTTHSSWVWERDLTEAYNPGTFSRLTTDGLYEFIPDSGVLESYRGNRLQDYMINNWFQDIGSFENAFRLGFGEFQFPGILDNNAPVTPAIVEVNIQTTINNVSIDDVNAVPGVLTDVFEIQGTNDRDERLVQFLVTPIPEPSSTSLFAIGLSWLVLTRRTRQRAPTPSL